MAGPDLTPAIRAVEALMDDACTITRDPEAETDDILDQETGQLTPPVGDLEPVYDGKCTIAAQQGTGREGGAAGAQYAVVNYTLTLPLSAPEIKRGDWVTWTSSRRDPVAVGQRFKIQHPIYKTMAVSRKAQLVAEE